MLKKKKTTNLGIKSRFLDFEHDFLTNKPIKLLQTWKFEYPNSSIQCQIIKKILFFIFKNIFFLLFT